MTPKYGSNAKPADSWRRLGIITDQAGSMAARRIAAAGCVALFYYVAAQLGELAAIPPTNVSALWPPSGIALSVVLLWGNGVWPGILLGELIGSTWGFFDSSTPAAVVASLGSGLLMAIGATLQPMLGAAVTRRLIGERSPLDSAADVFKFAALAPAMCVVGATIGVSALCLRGVAQWSDYGLTWWTWWLGDTVGVLLVTPVVLAWRQESPIRFRLGAVAEGATFLLLLVSIMGAVFGGIVPSPYADYPLEILLLPLLAWLALRSRPQVAGTVALLVALTAVGATASGLGPFARGALHQSVLLAQVFVAMVAVTMHAMVAVVGERRRAERALVQAHAELEKRVVERTAELTHANRALQAEVADRQRAESAVRESERNFRAIFEHVQDVYYRTDLDGNIQLISPSVARYGYTPDELVGRDVRLFYMDPAERERTIAVLMERHAVNDFEVELKRKDGLPVHGSATGHLLFDETGHPVGIEGMLRDISERKRAEAALHASEERFRALAHNTTDLVVVVEPNARVRYVSPSVERILGYMPAQVIGANAFDYLHPDDAAAVQDLFVHAMDQPGINPAAEFRARRTDGSWVWFESVANNLLDDPVVMGVVVSARDVTERKRVEEALREREERFRSLIENASDVITVLDGDGVMLYESPSTERVLGYDRRGFTGDSAFLFVHPDDIERLTRVFEELRHQPGATRAIEFRVRHGSGEWRVLEALARNQLDNPALAGIVVNSRDVTERKRAEDELQRSHAQLRALSARLQSVREEESTRIAREIHDELGQALTALKMDLAWVQNRVDGANAGTVSTKIAAMAQLVDATVQAVRKISTELRPGVLDDLGLTAAIEWQAREFQARTGIECTFTCAEDLAVDRARATALFRILQEGLTNVTRHARASRVEITLTHDSNQSVLTVRDNGKGITEQQILARNSLGLLGMRERAHAFGGAVAVRGTRGRGTEIIVRVPLELSGPDTQPPATTPTDGAPPGAAVPNGVVRVA